MSAASRRADPVTAEVFRHLFISIAEEMGVALERTAYSPNIKERRDYSCAVFDAQGQLIAQAAHIPVHLGAFPLLLSRLGPMFEWRPGDAVLCNDPFVAGTHLPDISLVSPVFASRGRLAGFVANRAHHADVGGAFPGSMAATTELYQEGIIIPPVRLYDRGELNQALLDLVLRNVRTPAERAGDFSAQLAANETGARRFVELLDRYGFREVQARAAVGIEQGERAVRSLLQDFPPGRFRFVDYLDDDGHGSGPLPISVDVGAENGRFNVDFEGSAPQQRGSVNAPLAVTLSAVYYAVICLLPEETPINAGVFRPIEIRAAAGTIVNALAPAAVAGGNVETSQRIVDAVLGALAQALPDRIPAASQGTMNNLTLGGIHPETGEPWAYYETLGGGAGASPSGPGVAGIHCHMSNTRNTPAEALEYHYPLRVTRYASRDGSGGAGRHSGGDGLIREIELLAPAAATLLADRRNRGPYGLQGGDPGASGLASVDTGAGPIAIAGKTSLSLPTGARLAVETPGGGGWGDAG